MEKLNIEQMKEIVKKDPELLQHLPRFHREVLSRLIDEKGIEQVQRRGLKKETPSRSL